MISKTRTQEAISAGGVVYREDGETLLIALCGRTRTATWNLPKGTPNSGETLEQTALREVQEETGLEVEIETGLGHIEYWFTREAQSFHKKVYFFLMGQRGGNFDLHDPEFDVVEWFTVQQAVKALTFKTESDVVRRAIKTLAPKSMDNG